MNLRPFAPSRMAAWCIVPYDSHERTPPQRAAMLRSLGLAGEAWDWRDEHAPLFGDELDALADAGLTLFGVWTPAVVPDEGPVGTIDDPVAGFLRELGRRGLSTDLWACAEFGAPGPVESLSARDQEARVARFADHLEPLAAAAGEAGSRVALYNHLGWYGEPTNQIEIIETLRDRGVSNVGIVYQQHHGHHHINHWPALLATMAPYLYTLGLNGMVPGQHWGGRKIHPLGRGGRDLALVTAVADSGWDGLVSVLCHTIDDAEARLRDNLEGLEWILSNLRGNDEAELPPARVPAPVWPH